MPMQVPLEIAFRNVPREDWAEAEIRKRVERLGKLSGRIVSCRVRVEQEAVATSGAALPRVHIELHLAGHPEIVIARDPSDLKARYHSPDLRGAITESFELAERRLMALKQQAKARTRAPGGAGLP